MAITSIRNEATAPGVLPTQADVLADSATTVPGHDITPARAYLQRLRAPGQLRRQSFADRLLGAIVRMGLPAVSSLAARIVERRATQDLYAAEAALPRMQLNLTLEGRPFTWTGALFKDAISSLPKGERMEAIENLTTTIQNRIDNGREIYRSVTTNQRPFPEASNKNVADFTLYLYAKAAIQGDDFVLGSFNIADPDGNLAEWLDTSVEHYARTSTHMTALQQLTITEHDGRQHQNVHRGIDLPPSPSTGLLGNLKTVLYGTIPPLEGTDGKRRLFLKAESFGIRFNTILLKGNVARRGNTGIHSRPARFFTDLKQSVGHMLSFMTTRGQQGNTACRKEHPPKALGKLLKTWRPLTRSVTDGKTRALLSKILDSGFERSGYGLRLLMKTVADVNRDLDEMRDRGEEIPSLVTGLLVDIDRIVDKLPNRNDLDVRVGNEVVLN